MNRLMYEFHKFLFDVDERLRKEVERERHILEGERYQAERERETMRTPSQDDKVRYCNVSTGQTDELPIREVMNRLERTIRNSNTF